MRRYGMSYWMDRLDPGRRRILLISPRGPLYRNRTGIWKKSLRYAPLTLTTLAALVPEELDAEVVVVDEGIHGIDWDAEADIVGISAITGTAPRSYELADHIRKRGVPVVLGAFIPHSSRAKRPDTPTPWSSATRKRPGRNSCETTSLAME